MHSTRLNNKTPGDIRADLARERINLIEADIETGMTFLRIAITEIGLGNMERTASLLEKAKLARAAVAKLLLDVEDSNVQQPLREKHQALDEAIGDVERRKRRYEQEQQIG